MIMSGQLISAWSKSELAADREHGALYALRADNGATVWRTPVPGGRYYTQPVVLDGSVYMSTEIGYVIAFNAATGAERWRYQPPHFEIGLSSLAAANGLIYVCVQRTFYALRARDGALRWQATVPGSADRTHQHYAPTVIHGILYALANNDETLYALKPDTGEEVWEYAGIGYSQGSVSVDRGVAYFATGDGGIVALRESDGKFIKRLDLNLYAEGPIAARGTP